MTIPDYGEFIADQAASDPLWVECDKCHGFGFIYETEEDHTPIRCPEIGCIYGKIRNPQLGP